MSYDAICKSLVESFPGDFVIYLTPTTSSLVYQTTFEIPRTRHEFDVVRLWEQPVDVFLNSPGLLPLATLANTQDRVKTLGQVALKVKQLPESEQSRIVSSTSFLAGLLLDNALIGKIMGQNLGYDLLLFNSTDDLNAWLEELVGE